MSEQYKLSSASLGSPQFPAVDHDEPCFLARDPRRQDYHLGGYTPVPARKSDRKPLVRGIRERGLHSGDNDRLESQRAGGTGNWRFRPGRRPCETHRRPEGGASRGRWGGQGCSGRCSGSRENPPAPGRDRRGAGARRERPPRVGPACPQPPATNLWPQTGCSCAQLGMQIYANSHCPSLVARSVNGWGKGRSTVSALRLPKGVQTGCGGHLPRPGPISGP